MSPKCFRVGRSMTGLGLFAIAPIKKLARRVAFTGRRVRTKTALERERTHGNKYMFEIDRRWTIDGSSRRNLARYANHACRPNAEAILYKGGIVIRALKTIQPGDEITYDYGSEYFDLFITPRGCKCTACGKPRAKRSNTRRAGDDQTSAS
jgi:SET domain-containing protein